MKNELLEQLNEQLNGFENQPDSDEYKNIAEIIEIIKGLDLSKLENKADKFEANGARVWLKLWTNGSKRRVYLNAIYRNGFRPNMVDNYIEF